MTSTPYPTLRRGGEPEPEPEQAQRPRLRKSEVAPERSVRVAAPVEHLRQHCQAAGGGSGHAGACRGGPPRPAAHDRRLQRTTHPQVAQVNNRQQ